MVKEISSFGKTSETESKTLKKQQDRQKAIEVMAKVNPLDNKTFKKFIKDAPAAMTVLIDLILI